MKDLENLDTSLLDQKVYNKIKSFLNNNFEQPIFSRWVVFISGVLLEFGFLWFIYHYLHKNISRFIPLLVFFTIFWLLFSFVRNRKSFLGITALFLFPFNRFLILENEQAFILGRVSDYLLLTLHIFEIPLIIYCSINVFGFLRELINRQLTVNISRKNIINSTTFFYVLLFFTIISAVANNSILTSFARLQIIFDGLMFYLILREVSYNQIFNIVSISAVFQSLVGIFQVVANRSIGLFWLGESVFNEGLLYISKAMIFDSLRVRTYGTFPHPNVLSGFLFVALVITLSYLINLNLRAGKLKTLTSENIKLAFVSTMILLGLYLGQSRTILVAIMLSLIVIIFILVFRHFKNIYGYIFLIGIVIAIALGFMLVFQERINSLFTYDRSSFSDRIVMQDMALEAIRKFPIFGLGPGGYLKFLGENRPILSNLSVIIEPVHNVFLLITSEIGIIPAMILLIEFIMILIRSCMRNVNNRYLYIVVPLVIYLLLSLNLDHYLVTLKQGVAIFALAMFLIDYKKETSLKKE